MIDICFKPEAAEVVAFCRRQDAKLCVHGNINSSIHGMTLDSRVVAQGFVFVALLGSRRDGRDFLDQAIEKRTSIVLTDTRSITPREGVIFMQSSRPHWLAAKLAAWLYGAQPSAQVLVTGTNGKTSVADYTRQLWHELGHSAASVGTLGVLGSTQKFQAGLTSPDCVRLAQILAELHIEGIQHVCIEASSHGLDQHRVDGAQPGVGVFTGLGRDHLDYHGTEHAYLAAKLRLFSELLPEDAAVLYAMDRQGGQTVCKISAQRGLSVRSFGIDSGDIQARGLTRAPDGIAFTLYDGHGSHKIRLNLIGDFQCLNVLAAYGAVVALGADRDHAASVLNELRSVPGRMQRIGSTSKGAVVYIDYAHTPDALAAVLQDVRQHFSGHLWLGFGCGGDRDQGKRLMMGQVARLADRVVVTDDNPRGEDAALIRQQVFRGIPEATEIGDRGAAIAYLCQKADAGDVVLIAGKGHERGQIVGDEVLPFDDAAVAQQYCTPDGGAS
ncbi:MAG: UDP-N-acetylmuramoyl-L-alanyl-D-glutamate--2,6-diaminopimelate ligase [Alphaproteobacteria bacterium]|nr:UDP-N-acetylmuramoyl-L-alanyl-D-glutamate--2,6-diaminopimelate ligase [Alphaproteobacteria bacterium]